jgi:uncharacterized repeat protein (TIGR01451 family)
MQAILRRSLVLTLVTVASFAPALAFASGPVNVALTAQRVTVNNGRESFGPADAARPGEVLQYRAVYRNDGAKPVNSLMATLPIPAGLEYLPRTAAPAVVLASLDGTTYAPVPLVRRVRNADGREVVQQVPPAEYRFLRWSIGTLSPKESRAVVARARVAPLQVAALER